MSDKFEEALQAAEVDNLAYNAGHGMKFDFLISKRPVADAALQAIIDRIEEEDTNGCPDITTAYLDICVILGQAGLVGSYNRDQQHKRSDDEILSSFPPKARCICGTPHHLDWDGWTE